MKKLLTVLSVWLLLSSCTKTGVTPVKTYSSIEGTWSINQSTVNYSATFDIVKGDAKYPYYVHNIIESLNSLSRTYVTAPQGLIELPNSSYNMLLPFTNGMVTLTGLTANANFTRITAVGGFIQSGTSSINLSPPITLTRTN